MKKFNIIKLNLPNQYYEIETRMEEALYTLLNDFDKIEDGLKKHHFLSFKTDINGITIDREASKKTLRIRSILIEALNWFNVERDLWENEYQNDLSPSEKELRDTYYLKKIIEFRFFLWT